MLFYQEVIFVPKQVSRSIQTYIADWYLSPVSQEAWRISEIEIIFGVKTTQ